MLYSIAVTVLSVISAYLLLGRWRMSRRPVHDIRGPRLTSRLLGNLIDIYQQGEVGELDFRWMREYGNVWKVADAFGNETLMVADPKAIQYLFHTSAYHSPKTKDVRVFSKLLGGRGIGGQTGANHQRHRKIMTPAFTAPRLREFLPVIRRAATTTTEKWRDMFSQADEGKVQVINIAYWLAKTTLDAIGETAFDYDFGALQSRQTELGSAYHNLFAETRFKSPTGLIFFRATWPYIPNAILNYMKYLPPFKRLRHYMDVSTKVANQLIDEKQEVYLRGGKGSGDMMSVLVRANAKENPRGQLDRPELIGQMVTLLLAGHETTATGLTWTLYEISRHPEIQEQLREEIYTARKAMKARGDNEFNMTDLDSMRLLLAVIKETLRFHPIAYNLIREIDRDDVVPLSKPITTASGREVTEIPVSKGQRFIISVCGYQRVPEVWGEDADTWNPLRFMDEHKRNLDTSATVGVFANLMTFSAGPHSCIGWRFAIMELQGIVSELVENFKFAPAPDVDIRRAPASVMTPMIRGRESEGTQLPLLVSLAE